MNLSEALTAVIDEQYTEHSTNEWMVKLGAVKGRDLFVLQDINFRIPALIAQYIDFPEGTEFGTFNNCREYGVTYSRNGWTFAAYEHRNSDQICIEGCLTTEMQPYGPYGGDDKFDTLSYDAPDDFYSVAQRLEAALRFASPERTRKDMKLVMRRGDGYEDLINDVAGDIANALDRRDKAQRDL